MEKIKQKNSIYKLILTDTGLAYELLYFLTKARKLNILNRFLDIITSPGFVIILYHKLKKTITYTIRKRGAFINNFYFVGYETQTDKFQLININHNFRAQVANNYDAKLEKYTFISANFADLKSIDMSFKPLLVVRDIKNYKGTIVLDGIYKFII